MIAYRSPAKINLFLHVVGLRPDGYHEILSGMQSVSLYDSIEIEPSQKATFSCSDPNLPTDSRNLVVKAHQLFEKKLNRPCPVHIHLQKNIPHQAGLGGGSSNAATTLFALNKLFYSPFTISDLMQLGAEIGSDVPFFFSHGTALCSGRGERVESIPVMEKQTVTLVKPRFGLATKKVYQAYKLQEKDDRTLYQNDLELPAFNLCPELKSIKEKLIEGGFEHVMLSGSGTCIFCLGEGLVDATLDVDVYHATFCSRDADGWY